MSSDAIVILRNGHQEIRQLFRHFRRKKEIVDRIVTTLTVHTYLEDEALCPESGG